MKPTLLPADVLRDVSVSTRTRSEQEKTPRRGKFREDRKHGVGINAQFNLNDRDFRLPNACAENSHKMQMAIQYSLSGHITLTSTATMFVSRDEASGKERCSLVSAPPALAARLRRYIGFPA